MTFRASPRIVVLVLVSCFCGIAPGQTPSRLTVEWMYSPEAAAVASTPDYVWLDDNSLILYDSSTEARTRRFERVDPAKGTRTVLMDASTSLASLRTLLGEKTPARLPFPIALDGGGQRALYLFAKDIFLLHLTTATFTRLTTTDEEEKSVAFSPDGSAISFIRSNNLWVYDIQRATARALTTDGSPTILNGTLSWVYWEEVFGRHDTGYWWSPDSRSIAFFRTDESDVSVQQYTDFKPWTPRVITQRYPKTGQPNPAVRVGVVDVASGKHVWVDLAHHDHEYVVRVHWLPDSKQLTVQTLNRLQTVLDLFFVDRGTGAARPVLREEDSAWVNVLDGFTLFNDGRRFLWPSERDGHQHLYLYSTDGKLERQVTRGPWTVREAGGGMWWMKGGVVGVDEKRGLVYFTALATSPIEKHLYVIGLDGTGMRRLSREEGSHSISFSPGMQFYVDRSSRCLHSARALTP